LKYVEQLEEDLPRIVGDRDKLVQVLINLFSNAVKFTDEEGRVLLCVKVNSDSSLTITITDTGVGISETDIDRLMAPFERANNAHTRSIEGAGLGLPLVASLVQLHGATMSIDSSVGKGTTVSIRFTAERVIWTNPENDMGESYDATVA